MTKILYFEVKKLKKRIKHYYIPITITISNLYKL